MPVCAATACQSAAGAGLSVRSAGEHSRAVAMLARTNRLSAVCSPRSIRLHVACEIPARLAAYRMLHPRSNRRAWICAPTAGSRVVIPVTVTPWRRRVVPGCTTGRTGGLAVFNEESQEA